MNILIKHQKFVNFFINMDMKSEKKFRNFSTLTPPPNESVEMSLYDNDYNFVINYF